MLLKKNIPELATLDFLDKIKNNYKLKFGVDPYNISDWDPSVNFKNEIIPNLKIPPINELIDYSFSYTNNYRAEILKSLGFDIKQKGCLITPSGSVSILCVVNWLNAMTDKIVHVFCPVYFSLIHNCNNFNIKITKQYLIKKQTNFSLPDNLNIIPSVVWITNPVYCTGVHINNKRIVGQLKQIMNNGKYLIADECLAISGKELSRTLGNEKNFIGIYAPHKSICVNGIKFSVIVFDKIHQDFFDHWADILYGCLPASSNSSISHFLSTNFINYQNLFLQRISETFNFIIKLCKPHDVVKYDKDGLGYLITLYFPKINGKLSLNSDFLHEMTYQTGGYFIPGIRNHFDPKFGLCFRVNLARDSPIFRSTIVRLINYLKQF